MDGVSSGAVGGAPMAASCSLLGTGERPLGGESAWPLPRRSPPFGASDGPALTLLPGEVTDERRIRLPCGCGFLKPCAPFFALLPTLRLGFDAATEVSPRTAGVGPPSDDPIDAAKASSSRE